MEYLKKASSTNEIKTSLIGMGDYEIPSGSVILASGDVLYSPSVSVVSETSVTITSKDMPHDEADSLNYIFTSMRAPFLYKKSGDTEWAGFIASTEFKFGQTSSYMYYKDINGSTVFSVRMYEVSLSDRTSTTLGTGTWVFRRLSFSFEQTN